MQRALPITWYFEEGVGLSDEPTAGPDAFIGGPGTSLPLRKSLSLPRRVMLAAAEVFPGISAGWTRACDGTLFADGQVSVCYKETSAITFCKWMSHSQTNAYTCIYEYVFAGYFFAYLFVSIFS